MKILGCQRGSSVCLLLSWTSFYLRFPWLKAEYSFRRHREREYHCAECGEGHSAQHPDPCLGRLPGVLGACCGHGDREEAYIGWKGDGPTIRGFTVVVPSGMSWEELWSPDPEEDPTHKSVTLSVDITGPDDEEDYVTLGKFVMDVAKDRLE